MPDLYDCLQRQLLEMEALAAVFSAPGEFVPDAETIGLIAATLDSVADRPQALQPATLPLLTARLLLHSVEGKEFAPVNDRSLEVVTWKEDIYLQCTLPHSYPEAVGPLLAICGGAHRRWHTLLDAADIHALMEELQGQECLMQVMQLVRAHVEEVLRAEREGDTQQRERWEALQRGKEERQRQEMLKVQAAVA
eukprot:EG_transcript_32306